LSSTSCRKRRSLPFVSASLRLSAVAAGETSRLSTCGRAGTGGRLGGRWFLQNLNIGMVLSASA
jgi:hypothetical protein